MRRTASLLIGLSLVVGIGFAGRASSGAHKPAYAYAGEAPNAPWRVAAERRIELYREGDLRVVVLGSGGLPVDGASVAVHMQRHAFRFGSAVAAEDLLGNTRDDEIYRQKVKQLFNTAVLANDLKWPRWEGGRRLALGGLAWLRKNGLAVRGHNLVWPSWRYLPGGTSDDPAATPNGVYAVYNELRNDEDPDTTHASAMEPLIASRAWLRNRVERHVEDEVTTLRGQLDEWDVVNEPYSNHMLQDILSSYAMVRWFRLAHEADPSARLFINDFGVLEARGRGTRHQNGYYRTIKYLIDEGAPLGGIGLQGHFSSGLASPAKLLETLNRFAAFGLPLEVTEFDVDTTDEQLQADYTRDFMTVVFSHPAVEGFVMWGFWQGAHRNAALYRNDWSIKPNGQVYNDLVFHRWWTDESGSTDGNGVYATRGFLGDYEIDVAKGAAKVTTDATLTRPGTTVTVRLRAE
jgi:GH35 family endo-1,4-beta-xylanase